EINPSVKLDPPPTSIASGVTKGGVLICSPDENTSPWPVNYCSAKCRAGFVVCAREKCLHPRHFNFGKPLKFGNLVNPDALVDLLFFPRIAGGVWFVGMM